YPFEAGNNTANIEAPAIASGAITPPPTLCATFHKAVFPPRSLTLYQCVNTRPAGGQPIPCTHPFRNNIINIMATVDVKYGMSPIAKLIMAERTKPSVIKIRALLRSETVPITNLLKPYAIEIADNANPSSPREKPSSIKYG